VKAGVTRRLIIKHLVEMEKWIEIGESARERRLKTETHFIW
jgi:hypothetical protein